MNDILKLLLLIFLIVVLFFTLYLLERNKNMDKIKRIIEEEENIIEEEENIIQKVEEEQLIEEEKYNKINKCKDKKLEKKDIKTNIKNNSLLKINNKCNLNLIKKKIDEDCLTKEEQTIFLNGLLDWGRDEYPTPEYIPKKLCYLK